MDALASTPAGREVSFSSGFTHDSADNSAVAHRAAVPASPSPPSLSEMTKRLRSGSTPGTARALTSGSNLQTLKQDGLVLVTVRKHMEALEEKFNSQLVRVQQQSDRLRDAAFSRVDAKLGTMENIQPKLDRRLAELSGNYKGLSDEMQTQIRRIDQMDSRLWEWRHQLEEEIRSKFNEIEQTHQQVASNVRMVNATNEDAFKRCNRRLTRLEGLVDERFGLAEDTQQGLMNLHERLAELEDIRNQELYKAEQLPVSKLTPSALPDSWQAAGDHVAMVALETRVAETSHKIEHWQRESHEIHSRLEAQEERLKSLRTLVDTKEEHYRWLSDRVERADWEGRFKELHSLVHELESHRVGLSEKLTLVQKKVETHEETQEDIGEQLRRNTDMISSTLSRIQHGSILSAGVLELSTTGGSNLIAHEEPITHQSESHIAAEVRDCLTKVRSLEAAIADLHKQKHNCDQDSSLASRMTVLLDQLKQVAPKVMEHETSLRELIEKVNRIEVEVRMDRAMYEAAAVGKKSDVMAARLGRLEVEVERIAGEVEGPAEEGDDEEDDEVADDKVTKPQELPARLLHRRASATE